MAAAVGPDHRFYLTADAVSYKGSPTNYVFSYTPDGKQVAAWPHFLRSGGIAIGLLNNVFVVDAQQEVVFRLDSGGRETARWGSDRTGPGWFQYPWDVAVDAGGDVYVVDYDRAHKYDRYGSLLTEWPVPENSWGIAVSGSGEVAVSAFEAKELSVFTDDGELITRWPLQEEVEGLDFDRDGNLLAAEYITGNIGRYDSQGSYIGFWFAGNQTSDVAVGPDGTVFAMRQSSPSVVELNADGQVITTWHGGVGVGIDVDEGGTVYIAAALGDLVRRYSPEGTLLTEWGGTGEGPGEFDGPGGLALGLDSTLYVTDFGNKRVQKFTRAGGFQEILGGDRNADGRFRVPTDAEVDSRGELYVVDTGNNRIQKFTPEGVFITKWGAFGSGNGEFNRPRGIAVDEADEVYVWDTGNSRVQVFDRSGTFLRMWPAADSVGVLEPWPDGLVGIDAGRDGSIYLVDSGRERVVEFDGNGVPRSEWGHTGSDAGSFNSPRDVAVDGDGVIFVVDVNNRRIQEFTDGHRDP